MAGSSLEAFGTSTVSSVRRMSLNQRAVLGGVFLTVVAVIFWVSQMGGSSSMGILYSGLEPDAAAGVVDELESRGIPYELTDSGRMIWVPRTLVGSTRLDMTSAGLPDTSDGWSILDNQGITSSEFDQRVGYQRAMEDELAATIAVIDGVASANVHLVIPEQDLFVGDETRPSASVLLITTNDASVSAGQVQAIVNLVASAIEGLNGADVTVTDSAGRLLAGGDAEGLTGMQADNHLQMRATFENDLEEELRQLLVAVVGPGRAVVNVSADLDFDAVTRTEETFSEAQNAEAQTLPQNETTRLEEYGDLSGPDEGTVDIETEILDGPAEEGDGPVNYRLDERDVVYALDSVVTSSEKAPGTIRSLSVAVAIDEQMVEADRLAELETLIGAAVGADAERGDVVAVNLLPFDVSLEEQETAAAAAAELPAGPGPVPLIRTVGAILLALFVLVLGLVLLRRGGKSQSVESLDLEALESGEGDDGDGPLALGSSDENDETTQATRAATEEDLLELVANQPDDIAVVLRQWLSQPDSVK